ncbi:hypothetical protein IQ266_14240 [filamentous cyanobacterium LEGE 11480]|uniref:Uncharacterized protein n=1 Tax=Romeriopsis navalis LEGE 11480 TaxID=2777977 RepID=A0A928VQX1_9CYAN|nr:hypothetical protein [Romeriopsis navalis]MBE9030892.1 hypothetical protein [Romeriopsis navalis LEGE 11480]
MFAKGCLYVVICSIGLLLLLENTVLSGLTQVPGSFGDAWLNNYFLEHSWQVISNRQYAGSLYSPIFFYPQSNVLALSENLFGTAPIYWLFRVFSKPNFAFILWFITNTILNFAATVFTLRRFRVRPILACLGGLLMAYAAQDAIRMSHAQLIPQFFTPLALYAIWRFIQQPSKRLLAIILGLTYWQVLSSIYLGWFLLFGIGITLLITPLVVPGTTTKIYRFIRQHWLFSSIAIAIWGGGLAVLLAPYLQAKSVVGARPYSEIILTLPQLSSWFLTPPFQNIWSPIFYILAPLLPQERIDEHILFLGMTVYVLAGWTAYVLLTKRATWLNPESRQLVTVTLGSAAILFLLSLSISSDGLSAWWFVYRFVPGASVIRAVTRISSLINIYLLIATLVMLDRRLAAKPMHRGLKAAFLAFLLCFATIEQSTGQLSRDIQAHQVAQQELSQLLKQNCQLAYYQFPPSAALGQLTATQTENLERFKIFPRNHPEVPTQLDWIAAQFLMMFAAIDVNIPVVNGHSGSTPEGLPHFNTTFDLPKMLNLIEQRSPQEIQQFCYITERWREDTLSTPSKPWSQNIIQSEHYTVQQISKTNPPS